MSVWCTTLMSLHRKKMSTARSTQTRSASACNPIINPNPIPVTLTLNLNTSITMQSYTYLIAYDKLEPNNPKRYRVAQNPTPLGWNDRWCAFTDLARCLDLTLLLYFCLAWWIMDVIITLLEGTSALWPRSRLARSSWPATVITTIETIRAI